VIGRGLPIGDGGEIVEVVLGEDGEDVAEVGNWAAELIGVFVVSRCLVPGLHSDGSLGVVRDSMRQGVPRS